jgi:hypothetical protein
VWVYCFRSPEVTGVLEAAGFEQQHPPPAAAATARGGAAASGGVVVDAEALAASRAAEVRHPPHPSFLRQNQR